MWSSKARVYLQAGMFPIPVLWSVAVAFLALPAVAAGQTLVPHSAEYKVRAKAGPIWIGGRQNVELRGDDRAYTVRHILKLVSVDITAEFSVDDGCLSPVSIQSQGRRNRSLNLVFDWDGDTARGTVGDKEMMLQFDGLVYGPVALQYRMMCDLMMHGEPAAGYRRLDLDAILEADAENGGTIQVPSDIIEVEESGKQRRVETGCGTFDAVSVTFRRQGSSRSTTYWFAEELDYLLVEMERHRKGKRITRQTLHRASLPGCTAN